jgi:Icc-related predicted phosphoesterase
MKLLCITDLHGSGAALSRIIDDAGPVDLILLGGDLTTFGTPDEAESLVRLACQAGPPVLAVAGNCDSPEIDRRLDRLGVGLHGRGRVIGGLGVHGLSAIPPWKPHMYQMTEEELAAALEAGRREIGGAERHVILSHAPPRDGSLDQIHFGCHVGSTALREVIERTRPALVVCGHVHEGRGVEMLGPTTVVNCGAASHGYYAVARVEPGTVKVEPAKA